MAENKRAVGSVTYHDAEHGYFERRKLRRHAAFWSLWALGVGAVISGDFYGWNLGLDAGGFGGLLIAGIVITIMYYGLCYSIAEMSPALPHTGGAYSFSRSAMGPWGGFITGLAENMEYVITPAVVVGAMGFLSHDIVYDLIGADGWWNSPVLWWAIFYIIFVGINILGIEITMRFTVVITMAALGILAFFFVAVLVTRSFDASLLTNIPPEQGGSSFLPKGIAGIFPALPFAIWFYLAIEGIANVAEDAIPTFQPTVQLRGSRPQAQDSDVGRERTQILDLEEVVQGGRNLFGRVDLSVGKALPEILGAYVEVNNLVGVRYNPIGNRLADSHTK